MDRERVKERRFSIYVPEDLVPEIQRCLDKGRALQELLFEAAPRRGLTPQQVLRSLILKRVKNWDYRELRERITPME